MKDEQYAKGYKFLAKSERGVSKMLLILLFDEENRMTACPGRGAFKQKSRHSIKL